MVAIAPDALIAHHKSAPGAGQGTIPDADRPESRNFRSGALHYVGQALSLTDSDRIGRSQAESLTYFPVPDPRSLVSIDSNRALRRDLETIFKAGTLAGLTDGQLLERFAARRGGGEGHAEAEAIFALLIERHGPMVMRVCRGVLGDAHDAEDALQATFLVLLRQAGSIRSRDSVGPWLHGVARRVASCARSAAARRRAHEHRWSERRRAEGDRGGFRERRARPDGHDPRRARAAARALPLADRALRPGGALARRGGASARLAAGDGQEPAQPRPSAAPRPPGAPRRGAGGRRAGALRLGAGGPGRGRAGRFRRAGRRHRADAGRRGEPAGRRAGPGQRSGEDDDHDEDETRRGRRDRAGAVGHRGRGARWRSSERRWIGRGDAPGRRRAGVAEDARSGEEQGTPWRRFATRADHRHGPRYRSGRTPGRRGHGLCHRHGAIDLR